MVNGGSGEFHMVSLRVFSHQVRGSINRAFNDQLCESNGRNGEHCLCIVRHHQFILSLKYDGTRRLIKWALLGGWLI